MGNLSLVELTEDLRYTELLVSIIEQNKEKIIEYYIIKERSIFEIDEEDENMFVSLLRDEVKGFQKTLKLTSIHLTSSILEFEKNEKIKNVSLEKLKDIISSLIVLGEKIGSEHFADIEDDIFEYHHIKNDSERVGELNDLLEYIDTLVNYIIELCSEIEVLLEMDDIEEREAI